MDEEKSLSVGFHFVVHYCDRPYSRAPVCNSNDAPFPLPGIANHTNNGPAHIKWAAQSFVF